MINPMKSVAMNATLEPLIGPGINRGRRWQSAIKSGIENGDLRNSSQDILDNLHAFDLGTDEMTITVSVVAAQPRMPAKDTFSWTVLSALAGTVDSRLGPDDQVAIVLRKRRETSLGASGEHGISGHSGHSGTRSG